MGIKNPWPFIIGGTALILWAIVYYGLTYVWGMIWG